jgi:uncharacterized OsmC-like protein
MPGRHRGVFYGGDAKEAATKGSGHCTSETSPSQQEVVMGAPHASFAIDSAKIKHYMDRRREAVRNAITAMPADITHTVPIEAVVRKVDEGISDAAFPSTPGNFVLRADEAAEPAFYGKGSAPKPLDVFLAGAGATMASVCVEAAADLGLPINALEVRVRGDLDVEGILDLHGDGYGSRSGFSHITYTVDIYTDAPLGHFRTLFDAIERRCPVLNTLRRGTHTDLRYRVNGAAAS